MTRETIELMAKLADKRKIQELYATLCRRLGRSYARDVNSEGPELFAYNVIAYALDYAIDETELLEMVS